MDSPYFEILRLVVFVLLTGWLIYFLGKVFIGYFIKELPKMIRYEFTTVMGIISFLGFLALLGFFMEKSIFSQLVQLLTPKGSEAAITESKSKFDQTLIWGMVIELLGNLVIIAIVKIFSLKNNR